MEIIRFTSVSRVLVFDHWSEEEMSLWEYLKRRFAETSFDRFMPPREHKMKLKEWIGLIVIVLVGIVFVYLAFSNPHMTHQELLINFYPEYAIGATVVVGTFWLVWGRKGK